MPLSKELSNVSQNKVDKKETNKKDLKKIMSEKGDNGKQEKISENNFFIDAKNKKKNDKEIVEEANQKRKEKGNKYINEKKSSLLSQRRPTLIRG